MSTMMHVTPLPTVRSPRPPVNYCTASTEQSVCDRTDSHGPGEHYDWITRETF